MASNSRTARLAVTAAALALSGLVLAASARWSATHVIDATRAEATAAATHLGGLLSAAIDRARLHADHLAALPVVRGVIESDVATVRELARARGLVFRPAPHETIELFQVLPHQRPLSLLRAPETSQSLGIAKANQVRVDEENGALVVTVAVPVQPLPPSWIEGALAVATRVDLAPLAASLAKSGLGAELEGLGEPVMLAPQRSPDGARTVVVPVPLGGVDARGTPPALTIRASVRPGGGAVLWAGRVLLVAAFLAALLTFAANRSAMPAIDDAPTARRQTYRRARTTAPEADAPEWAIDPEPTVRDKRGDGNYLALAWNAHEPTPITTLKPQESAPILVDPRGDQLASRYRLLQSLGHGHAADVYLAQSFLSGSPGTVALKILGGRASAERASFLEAARRQMRVRHDNVARVLDVGEPGGDLCYVATEYVEGCTLELLLRDLFARDEPLPLPQTVAIMAAICRALDAAHPLVHGAVKPSNVLVGRHSFVKLADFGAPPSPSDRNAPEQYAGRAPDRRSDVYAVGVVLHELATGRRLALAPTDGVGAQRWPPLPAPSTIRAGLPRGLDAVVGKATCFGPRGRYATAGELLGELMRATEGPAGRTKTKDAWLGDWVERARRSS